MYRTITIIQLILQMNWPLLCTAGVLHHKSSHTSPVNAPNCIVLYTSVNVTPLCGHLCSVNIIWGTLSWGSVVKGASRIPFWTGKPLCHTSNLCSLKWCSALVSLLHLRIYVATVHRTEFVSATTSPGPDRQRTTNILFIVVFEEDYSSDKRKRDIRKE